ncbi:MAG: hypothetical protein M3461_18280 [Pseudomonadota bacterium]|nr:hypothetical protein [Pseudomonadota bacterium]
MSWGKFWLAMLNLYDWAGLHPLVPELWALPRRLPIHPERFYCHTRLIYLAMTVIYASRHQIPRGPVIEVLRAELYPAGYGGFREQRAALRSGYLYARPGRALRCLYAFFLFMEKARRRGAAEDRSAPSNRRTRLAPRSPSVRT